jgi:cation diffusion facilitator CzcD-associated flavoprotein CzcO
MFTLGYSFSPWEGEEAIADGPSILRYIRDTARAHGVDKEIRYHRRVVRAAWSSDESLWTVDVEHADTRQTERVTCGFLFANTGYYRYDEGYTPEFAGAEAFTGRIVHPQHWPADLDWTDKRVVVIGSGATAVTLVPALAHAAHVTMLQRSPSYVLSVPQRDAMAVALRRALPSKVAYPIVRWRNLLVTMLIFQLSRLAPTFMKGLLRKGVVSQLPAGYDVATHFEPHYQPWDQRLCLAPDGDFFRAISDGRASVVTDRIETMTADGLRLESGVELPADVIVTATGLTMLALGGMTVVVDGRTVDISETVSYKGVMICGVPNLAMTFGYTNASWTLKADLAARYVCRLLRYMDAHGHVRCVAREPDPALATRPFLDLSSGYVVRSGGRFPKQASRAPWRVRQNYVRDVLALRYGRLDDGITFAGAP